MIEISSRRSSFIIFSISIAILTTYGIIEAQFLAPYPWTEDSFESKKGNIDINMTMESILHKNRVVKGDVVKYDFEIKNNSEKSFFINFHYIVSRIQGDEKTYEIKRYTLSPDNNEDNPLRIPSEDESDLRILIENDGVHSIHVYFDIYQQDEPSELIDSVIRTHTYHVVTLDQYYSLLDKQAFYTFLGIIAIPSILVSIKLAKELFFPKPDTK